MKPAWVPGASRASECEAPLVWRPSSVYSSALAVSIQKSSRTAELHAAREYPQSCQPGLRSVVCGVASAGTCVICKASFVMYDQPARERPDIFSVAGGETIHPGNLYAEYRKGHPTYIRSRGAILGMDVSIRDRYERYGTLIRERFPSLQGAEIRRQPLPDQAWRYRELSFTPYDRGNCAPGK